MQISKPAGTLCLILLALFVLGTGPFAWLLGALSPLAIAICIIYLLQPFVNNLQRISCLPRWICILLCFAGILLILLLFIFLLFPRLTDGIRLLFSLDWTAFMEYPLIQKIARFLPVEEWIGRIPDLLSDLLSPLLRYSASVVQWVGNFCMSSCIAYYAMKDTTDICLSLSRYILRLLPRRAANILLNLIDILDHTFWTYLRGKLFISIILFLSCSLLFFLISLLLNMAIPSPVLLGAVIALTNLIPLVGPMIGTGFCLLLALFSGFPETLAVLAICLGAQVADNIFLTPRLGAPFGLSPFWILTSVAIFSLLFGIAGMVLSIPVLAACSELWRRYEKSPDFLLETPPRFRPRH